MFTVGEVISMLALCADREDIYLMRKGIYGIEVMNDHIEVAFTDGNTADIKIYEDGRKEYRREDGC